MKLVQGVMGGARSRGPVVACRITRSVEGEGVVVRRGVVRSVFSSVLTQQGNTVEETACRQNLQAGRAVANTKLHSQYGNLRQSSRGTEELATQANHRSTMQKYTVEPRCEQPHRLTKRSGDQQEGIQRL